VLTELRQGLGRGKKEREPRIAYALKESREKSEQVRSHPSGVRKKACQTLDGCSKSAEERARKRRAVSNGCNCRERRAAEGRKVLKSAKEGARQRCSSARVASGKTRG